MLEGTPFVSFDNRSLYFSSDRDGSYDLYVATRPGTGAPFEILVKLGPEVNTPNLTEYSPTMTADGLKLFFHRGPPSVGDRDLWVVTRASTDEPFGESGAPVRLEGVNTGYKEYKPSVSADGSVVFFSDFTDSFRPGGIGSTDIWVATAIDPPFAFTEPVNLNDLWPGSDVNTVFHEGIVSISADWPAGGSKLYFTSNRPGTLGGSQDADIWEATWVPGRLPPDPPRNLTAAAGDGKVDLAWPR